MDIHFLYKVISLKGAGIPDTMEGQERVLGGETESAGQGLGNGGHPLGIVGTSPLRF